MAELNAAEDRTNPENRVGAAKIDLSLMPPTGIIHGAHAFMDSADDWIFSTRGNGDQAPTVTDLGAQRLERHRNADIRQIVSVR
ncbi:hypothetical protein GOFOIKOB_4881 [Methylobacterium tardum]|uniref:Uncharacterized protein n=1 Tax=Methylobacterium tardum TaxID=374432 RepID=A0AA37WTF5_9HYPH|nr:hypothetical protein GOFOIKOB_4881 [Methylobacterium tardum]GLS72326.1 hypothetical protein GCM10007890_43390 [Methylobacterium tardum]